MFINKLIENFSVETLVEFVRQKIRTFKQDEENYEYLFDDKDYINENYQDIVKIGEAVLNDSEDILILTAKTLSYLTNRTGKKRQYEIAKKILKEENKDSAIFVFYDDEGNFRFSLIRTNFSGTKRTFTDFKRYTYFVSPKQTNKTFINQISSCDFSNLDAIQEAFSVEPLTKEFYQKVTNAFYSLVGGNIVSGNKTINIKGTLNLPGYDIILNKKVYQEFAVRLIGRIIFVWFLKNKTSDNNVPLIPKEWLSSKKVKVTEDYYHNLLEKLFFEILNKPMRERIEELPNGHEKIPFLNGGLFEPLSEDFYELSGFGGASKYLNTLIVPDKWIIDFFETLEQFNFTIDENSLNDQEVSIDPEMLGTIFENLLAEIDPETEKTARKSTGSFYTPREIVDFMTEEALITYLNDKTKIKEDKLKNIFIENNLELVDLTENEKSNLIDAFDTLKILDPACGSGAFLIGALHKINIALENLDPEGNIWKERQLEKIKNSVLKRILKEKFEKSNVDYIRKLGIIQNSIYGVDIQEIATEISKLRCFLSLIVDETIEDNADNRGIFPLPNLEFKFITADFLKGLEKVSFDFTSFGDNLKNLQNIREEYLQSYGREKENLKNKFLSLQKDIVIKELKVGTQGVNKRLMQIVDWNPFENRKSDWFEPELMFGIKFFDIVIGNPPYIQLQKAYSSREKFADLYKDENFKTFERTGDIYTLFIERGLDLSKKEEGILCFITSNKWMRANYGKSLRRFLSRKTPIKLIDLGPGIFNTATVDTSIIIVKNKNVKNTTQHNLKALTLNQKKELKEISNDNFNMLTRLSEESWIILTPQEQKIKEKIERIGTPLREWDIKIYRGVLTGYNEAFIIDGKTKDELISKDPKSAEIIKPILRGRDIKRYKAEFADLWLINTHNGYTNSKGQQIPPININNYPAIKDHLDKYWDRLERRQDKGITPYNLRNCAYLEEFEKEKIVYQEIVQTPQFYYEKQKYYPEATTFIITGKNIKYLIALLNSIPVSFFFKKYYAGGGLGEKGFRYKKAFLVNLPIPKIPEAQQKPFEKLVDIIIEKKERGEDTTAEEQKIDIMVYKLYEFTYDEVKIVDPEFPLSKDEYENFKLQIK